MEVSRPATANTSIKQFLVETDSRKKRETLRDLLRAEEVSTAIIFCNRKTTVRELATSLKRDGFAAGEIHGDMEQRDRIAELDRFKAGTINILVASDVAARGLDVKGVSHVFNYDAPWHPDDYIHRIGRTGRAGATGIAYTLATSADAEAIENIEKLTGLKIERFGKPARAAESREEPKREEAKRERAKPERPRREKTAERVETKTERPRREEREAPRAESKPARVESKPARVESKPPRTARPPVRDDEPDDGWNGPMPGFLSVKLGD